MNGDERAASKGCKSFMLELRDGCWASTVDNQRGRSKRPVSMCGAAGMDAGADRSTISQQDAPSEKEPFPATMLNGDSLM